MAARSLPDALRSHRTSLARHWRIGVGAALMLSACGEFLRATPEDRVGILRELIRARAVSGDSALIDACSIDRFLVDLQTWRDSLLPAEIARVGTETECAAAPRPRAGRFVITRWYQNPGGDYVVRGTDYPWDVVYRFSDGIFSRKERTSEDEFSAGIASPARVDSSLDSSALTPAAAARDTGAAPTTRDSAAARSPGGARRSSRPPR